MREFDQAQINAHDAMENLTEHIRMRNGVFSEESDTCQHKAALHANTKELEECRQTGGMEFEQAQSNAEHIDRAHALTYSRVEKVFERLFSFRKFWRREHFC